MHLKHCLMICSELPGPFLSLRVCTVLSSHELECCRRWEHHALSFCVGSESCLHLQHNWGSGGCLHSEARQARQLLGTAAGGLCRGFQELWLRRRPAISGVQHDASLCGQKLCEGTKDCHCAKGQQAVTVKRGNRLSLCKETACCQCANWKGDKGKKGQEHCDPTPEACKAARQWI